MGYRTFVDRDGAYWQVWDSQPTRVERRGDAADRRRPRMMPWHGTERRAGTDRRMTSQRRILLSQGFGSGWLTFESQAEKRRLNPIPSRWEAMNETELRTLCERAKRVERVDDSSAA
ncbi:MAG: hypothetical protein M3365_12035 [Gemmatimonadota bacterium]|nr:hypothetical protein [Gemmatimonadota bacterium]